MSETTNLLHPAVEGELRALGLEFEAMECDPSLADTAAFCEHYKFTPEQTCNAIVVIAKADPPKFACCVVLANCKLDVNKKVSQLLGIKRCSFASGEQTLEITGMEIGGVTPFGIPEMAVYFDSAILNNEKIVLGGGNRSSKLLLNPAELKKAPQVEIVEGLGIPR